MRFSMSLRWTKWGSKTQNGLLTCKIALRLKKTCYKVCLCENCQQQSCKAFIGLTILCKNDWWGRLLLRENLADTDPPFSKTPIFDLFRGCVLTFTSCYLNIFDNRCTRLNGPALQNVFCAVGLSDVRCTLFALIFCQNLHTLQRGLSAIADRLVLIAYTL